ncbi:aldo/keto reductase [Georgenia sp. 311]|uniref:aldo/keto reductase n=1 Tax=Georgenia sp. 311 TaxID=2585134 RepID=UPI001111F5DA|nr:aldo/keto reductase [Georgenia sp. 311]TNC17220.1 aldo/keto reductase [Georgenia sp. 311]
MDTRTLGRTGRTVSVIGQGTWQLGSDWGEVSEEDARAVLDAAVESGVTMLDTADVYGDGRSEALIGRWLRDNPGLDVTVATKMGRRLPQEPANYSMDNFRAWTDRSRRNLGVDTLDLVQLHCPPTAVYGIDRVFDDLDTLVSEGVMASYGVSVELVEEALAAIARPNVATVQIILNAFRLKPLEQVLPAAREAGVGIIARVPLASGLLSGRYTPETTFPDTDHRSFNRNGEAFDVGETFSGVDFETGVRAATEFAAAARLLVPGASTAQVALAWVAAQDGVSTVIPGARSPEQARANAAAGSLELPAELDDVVRTIYDRDLREAVHPRW